VENASAHRLLQRVKRIRQHLGQSQEEFAENADLKYKHYQSIEAGRKVDLRLSTLEKLAKACRLELSELLDFRTDPLPRAGEDRQAEFRTAPRSRSRRRRA
jgi:transcriptional regulator with XRE-family HTH domain